MEDELGVTRVPLYLTPHPHGVRVRVHVHGGIPVWCECADQMKRARMQWGCV